MAIEHIGLKPRPFAAHRALSAAQHQARIDALRQPGAVQAQRHALHPARLEAVQEGQNAQGSLRGRGQNRLVGPVRLA